MPQIRKTPFEEEMSHRPSRALPRAEFAGGKPKCPKHLSPEARIEWRRCVKLMLARETITPGDFALLAVYSEVFARWVSAKAEMGGQLMVQETVLTSNGTPIPKMKLNPLLEVVSVCEMNIKKLVEQLGLTPATREKVKPTNGGSKAPLPSNSLGVKYPELFRK